MKQGLVVLLASILATTASAHAFLQHSQPGAGASLKTTPKQIALTFSESLEPSFSGIEVTDAAGHQVETSQVTVNGPSVRAALKRLPPGRYRVKWHAVSADSHRTDGQFTFTVQP